MCVFGEREIGYSQKAPNLKTFLGIKKFRDLEIIGIGRFVFWSAFYQTFWYVEEITVKFISKFSHFKFHFQNKKLWELFRN